MTTEPFTPHADSIQTAWVIVCQQSRIATQPPVEELEAEFNRFLARTKADALREAARGFALSPHVSHPGTAVHEALARRADQIEDES